MEPSRGLYGGAGNTFLKQFSEPSAQFRITQLREILAGEGHERRDIAKSR